MFDGFWYGIFGGLFGPAIAKWLAKFKYWMIFLVVMLGTHIVFFIVGAYARGLPFAIQAASKYTFTPVGILFPIGVGIFAVIVAFLGSLSAPKKPVENDKNKP
jgi:hypothetical protein